MPAAAVRDGARVFNAPDAIRDHNEKLAIAEFARFAAPTLVSRQPERIQAFIDEQASQCGFCLSGVILSAKAILDLPRTVEMLETLGVPVFGVRTNEFPAFYRRASGLSVDSRMDTIEELASAMRTHFALGLGTGVLIANPIPASDELPTETYERALETALSDAERQDVRGRSVTPFLLERLRALSEGESVRELVDPRCQLRAPRDVAAPWLVSHQRERVAGDE